MVIGIASRAERALDLLNSQVIDAVVLDISLSGHVDGIKVAKIINSKYKLPFIFLTSFADRVTLDRAKLAMPYGYIVKPFDENDLLTALEVAIFNHGRHQPKPAFPTMEEINTQYEKNISEREYEVITSIFEGLNNQEMASKYFVTENTIKSHIKRIYSKLGVNSRSNLIKELLIDRS